MRWTKPRAANTAGWSVNCRSPVLRHAKKGAQPQCWALATASRDPMRDVHRMLRVCTIPGHLTRSDVAFLDHPRPLSYASPSNLLRLWRIGEEQASPAPQQPERELVCSHT